MIENFSYEEHLPILGRWLAHWGILPPPRHLFSDLGFVVHGVAIGFLFTTNSGSAYIDHIVANPNATVIARDAALNDLFNHLMVVAESKGCGFLTAMTRIPKMKSRIESIGFTSDKDYTVFYKILGGQKCLG